MVQVFIKQPSVACPGPYEPTQEVATPHVVRRQHVSPTMRARLPIGREGACFQAGGKLAAMRLGFGTHHCERLQVIYELSVPTALQPKFPVEQPSCDGQIRLRRA
jgi:hypothetical protein